MESPAPINEELLYLFHIRPYIELLKKADKGEFDRAMLDAGLGTDENPVFRGMFRHAFVVAGGTYRGAMALAEGEARLSSIRLQASTTQNRTTPPASAM